MKHLIYAVLFTLIFSQSVIADDKKDKKKRNRRNNNANV